MAKTISRSISIKICDLDRPKKVSLALTHLLFGGLVRQHSMWLRANETRPLFTEIFGSVENDGDPADDDQGSKATEESRSLYNPLTQPDCKAGALRILNALRQRGVPKAEIEPTLHSYIDLLRTDPSGSIAQPWFDEFFDVRVGRSKWLTKSSATASGFALKTSEDPKEEKEIADAFHAWLSSQALRYLDEAREGWFAASGFRAIQNLVKCKSEEERHGLSSNKGGKPRRGQGRIEGEFDFGAFARAFESVAAYRSWVRRRAAERRQRSEDIKKYEALKSAPEWQLLSAYEELARARHAQNCAMPIKTPYRIGAKGDTKGWTTVRRNAIRAILESNADPGAALHEAYHEQQLNNPELVPDHELIDFCANHPELWDGRSAKSDKKRMAKEHDWVRRRASYTRDTEPLRDITWTPPHPLLHPKWSGFGLNDLTNSLPIREFDPATGVMVLSAFVVGPNNVLEMTTHKIRCAPHRRLKIDGDKLSLTWGSPASANPRLSVPIEKLGQFTLRLDRQHLDRIYRQLDPKYRDALANPDPQTFLDACLAVAEIIADDPKTTFSWGVSVKFDQPALNLPGKVTKFSKTAEPALRGLLRSAKEIEAFDGATIVGLDLGVRCQAVTLCRFHADPTKGEFRVGSGSMSILDRRRLHLPGEVETEPSDKVETEPPRLTKLKTLLTLATTQLNFSRRLVRAVRNPHTFNVENEIDRPARTKRHWLPSPEDLSPFPEIALEINLKISALAAKIDAYKSARSTESAFEALCVAEELNRTLHKLIEEVVHPKDEHQPMGGLSLYRIDALVQYRRYQQSFVTRGRPTPKGSIYSQRAPKNFGARTLKKINKLKQERSRTLAALIVQYAMGGDYAAQITGGTKGLPRADILVMEELSKYTTSRDRSHRDNRMLSRWAHRNVTQWLTLGCKTQGIALAAVPASYSSQFEARSGIPGVRAQHVKTNWIGAPWWEAKLKRQPELQFVKPYDLIPFRGGPEFLWLDPTTGAYQRVNADENASTNIARRFFESPFERQMPVYVGIVNGQLRPIKDNAKKMCFEVESNDDEGPRVLLAVPSPTSKKIPAFEDQSSWKFHQASPERWIRADVFWREVEQKIWAVLRESV